MDLATFHADSIWWLCVVLSVPRYTPGCRPWRMWYKPQSSLTSPTLVEPYRDLFALPSTFDTSCYVVCTFFNARGYIGKASCNRPTGTACGALDLSKGAQSQYIFICS